MKKLAFLLLIFLAAPKIIHGKSAKAKGDDVQVDSSSAHSPSLPNGGKKIAKRRKNSKQPKPVAEYSRQGTVATIRFLRSGKILKIEDKHIEATAETVAATLAGEEGNNDPDKKIKAKFEGMIRKKTLKSSDKAQINIHYLISENFGFVQVERGFKIDGAELEEEGIAVGGGMTTYDQDGNVIFPESRAEIRPIHAKGYFIKLAEEGPGCSLIDLRGAELAKLPYCGVVFPSPSGMFFLVLETPYVDSGAVSRFAVVDVSSHSVKFGKEIITHDTERDDWGVTNLGIVVRTDKRPETFGVTRTVKAE